MSVAVVCVRTGINWGLYAESTSRPGTMTNRFDFEAVVALKLTSVFSFRHESSWEAKTERMIDAFKGIPKVCWASEKSGMIDLPIVAFLYLLESSLTVMVVQSVVPPNKPQWAPVKPSEQTH